MNTDVVPSANDALHNLLLQLSSFSTDFFAFIVITAAVLLFALYFGRDRIAPLIAALYGALTLYGAFPFPSMVQGPYMQIGLYVVFTVLLFIAFSGLSYFMAARSGGFVAEIIMAVLIAGFLLAVSIHILPVQEVYAFTGATKDLFASNQAFFWWLVGPAVGLFFIGR